MTGEEIHARYRHVLAWRQQGWSFLQIADQLGVTETRARALYAAATAWGATLGEHLAADAPVAALRIGRQAIAGLQQAGITTIAEVAALGDADLLSIRNIGPEKVAQLRADLAARYTQGP